MKRPIHGDIMVATGNNLLDTLRWAATNVNEAIAKAADTSVNARMEDIEARDPETGKTPLHYAVELAVATGHYDTALNLINKGADINVADKTHMSPLAVARNYAEEAPGLTQKMIDTARNALAQHPRGMGVAL
jgi:hypothetical protein